MKKSWFRSRRFIHIIMHQSVYQGYCHWKVWALLEHHSFGQVLMPYGHLGERLFFTYWYIALVLIRYVIFANFSHLGFRISDVRVIAMSKSGNIWTTLSNVYLFFMGLRWCILSCGYIGIKMECCNFDMQCI